MVVAVCLAALATLHHVFNWVYGCMTRDRDQACVPDWDTEVDKPSSTPLLGDPSASGDPGRRQDGDCEAKAASGSGGPAAGLSWVFGWLFRAVSQAELAKRICSLDVFRGLCLTTMAVYNYGGGDYWFLNHSPWDGLTFADLAFPWCAVHAYHCHVLCHHLMLAFAVALNHRPAQVCMDHGCVCSCGHDESHVKI